jgi:hypothetical protein
MFLVREIKTNHESTKKGKHEILKSFFVFSIFRDKNLIHFFLAWARFSYGLLWRVHANRVSQNDIAPIFD